MIRVPISNVCMILEQVTIFRNIGFPYAYGHYHHHEQYLNTIGVREQKQYQFGLVANLISFISKTQIGEHQLPIYLLSTYLLYYLLLKTNNNTFILAPCCILISPFFHLHWHSFSRRLISKWPMEHAWTTDLIRTKLWDANPGTCW